jgi:multidrug efflux system membrane fusion protein
MKTQGKYLAAAGVLVLGALVWRLFPDDSGAKPVDAEPAQAIPVLAGEVATRDVPLYASGIGTVQAYNTVTVQARVDGQLDSVDFQEGQDVKEGQVLARIDPRPFQAALDNAVANLAKDQAMLANARRDLSRYQDTAAKGYSSRQQLDTQTASVGSLEATIQADKATIENAEVQLGYTTITAPIDGRTGIRHIDKGNIVHAADTGGLVVITQLKPISLIFTLPQDDLPAIAAAQKNGKLAVTAFTRTGTTQLGVGVLELVDNEIDPATGTIRLKARFPNDDLTLWPGEFVNARLQIGIVRNGLTVDSRVPQRGLNGVVAYVIKPDDTVEIRPIAVGQDYQGQTIVNKGLSAGDRVVVDGQLRLESGSKVSAKLVSDPLQTGSLALPTP